MLLLLLLAVVSVEINQEENAHLPLGSDLSVRRPGVGRFAPGWEVYVESVVWPCRVSEIGRVWVICRHESKDYGGFPSFFGNIFLEETAFLRQ